LFFTHGSFLFYIKINKEREEGPKAGRGGRKGEQKRKEAKLFLSSILHTVRRRWVEP